MSFDTCVCMCGRGRGTRLHELREDNVGVAQVTASEVLEHSPREEQVLLRRVAYHVDGSEQKSVCRWGSASAAAVLGADVFSHDGCRGYGARTPCTAFELPAERVYSFLSRVDTPEWALPS